MSGWVICPIFCSSVIPATIEWTRASIAASGAAAAVRTGQTPCVVWQEASNAAARHRSTLDRACPALVNTNIRVSLEFIVQTKEPLPAVFLIGFDERIAV